MLCAAVALSRCSQLTLPRL